MRRALSWFGVVLSAVALGLAGPSVPACACSCLPTTEKKAYTDADAVFVGVVVRREAPRHPHSSADTVRLILKVRAVYKGFVLPRQRIWTQYSSASCGIEAQVGNRYLIFATQLNGGLNASLCGGTRSVSGVPSQVGGHPPVRTWPF